MGTAPLEDCSNLTRYCKFGSHDLLISSFVGISKEISLISTFNALLTPKGLMIHMHHFSYIHKLYYLLKCEQIENIQLCRSPK